MIDRWRPPHRCSPPLPLTHARHGGRGPSAASLGHGGRGPNAATLMHGGRGQSAAALGHGRRGRATAPTGKAGAAMACVSQGGGEQRWGERRRSAAVERCSPR